VSEPVIYIDSSEVREGRLDELKAAVRDLAAFVEANEPWLIAYRVYLAEDARHMSVMHIHRDAASLERHMRVAGPACQPFVDLVTLLSIDGYGTLSEPLLEQLYHKAHMLGGRHAIVRVHRLHAGFARLGNG
jgi:quinol monooxygenase YgiN